MPTVSRVAHWIGIVAALVPVPFAIQDLIALRLWEAEWYWIPFAILFTALVSGAAYCLVVGIGVVIGKLGR